MINDLTIYTLFDQFKKLVPLFHGNYIATDQ